MEMFHHLGLTLRLLRELRGQSQGQVAKEAGISKSQLSKYENGRLPKLETLERLLASLGVEYFQFFYTLYLVDRRAASLDRLAQNADPKGARSKGDDNDRLLADLREEQSVLLPAFLEGGRSQSLEQGFKKIFDDLLGVYRMVFEELLLSHQARS
ncbi:MAG TPA: helix-turn-helix transcriptional regulator [Thermoanaerobaculia bacterium]|nr:helix-turn-helix transcriptional regulator [Thermoanaerobaculia bacterium]